MEDSLILMYVKDDVVYPVALSQDQVETWQIIQQMIPQPIKVIGDHPIGKAINLLKK